MIIIFSIEFLYKNPYMQLRIKMQPFVVLTLLGSANAFFAGSRQVGARNMQRRMAEEAWFPSSVATQGAKLSALK